MPASVVLCHFRSALGVRDHIPVVSLGPTSSPGPNGRPLAAAGFQKSRAMLFLGGPVRSPMSYLFATSFSGVSWKSFAGEHTSSALWKTTPPRRVLRAFFNPVPLTFHWVQMPSSKSFCPIVARESTMSFPQWAQFGALFFCSGWETTFRKVAV